MPVQSNLFPDPPNPRDAAPPQAAAPHAENTSANTAAPDTAPVWLQRTSLFILVIFCLYLGAIVTILPWWSAVWDHNLFFTSHPRLWSILRLGAVRGIISGLGLLDLWIGISEAINYRDHRI